MDVWETRSDIDPCARVFIGRCPKVLRMLRRLERFARVDVPVLVLGETGTGKELVVRLWHRIGRRRARPFVPINCGAIPEALVESELFGHRRGAFTDASRDRVGLVEEAEGGVLFLDEIDSLSARAQVALLRFLQEGRYRRVGDGRERSADVAVVAACNVDLEALASAGRFRKDLYYRVDVARLQIPPLRERGDDILLLAQHFLEKFLRRYEFGPSRFSAATEAWMMAHPWPGNVRELENFVHRAFLLAAGDEICATGDSDDAGLTDEPSEVEPFKPARQRVVEQFEKHYLERLMSRCHGNVTRAAKLAGKERRSLGKMLKKYGIDRRLYLDRRSG